MGDYNINEQKNNLYYTIVKINYLNIIYIIVCVMVRSLPYSRTQRSKWSLTSSCQSSRVFDMNSTNKCEIDVPSVCYLQGKFDVLLLQIVRKLVQLENGSWLSPVQTHIN